MINYPATLFLGGHYLLFAGIPAVSNGSVHSAFIWKVIVTVSATSILAETLLRLSTRGKSVKHYANVHSAGRSWPDVGNAAMWLILGVGLAASVAGNVGGPGYASQVGAVAVASWSPLVTPFEPWMLLGVGMLINQTLNGRVSRRVGYSTIGFVCALMLVLDLQAGIINRTVSTIAAIVLCLFVVGLIRPTLLILVALIAVSSWPVLQDIRDDSRSTIIGSQIESQEPFERLQVDKQLEHAPFLRSNPALLDLPDAILLIRTGLIPSVVDSDRPPLDVGSQFNVALGGSAESSTSATALGNVYIYGGFVGITIYALVVSVLYRSFIRLRTSLGLAGLMLTYTLFTSFSSSFPVVIPAVLQTTLSFLMAGSIVWLLRDRGGNWERGKINRR